MSLADRIVEMAVVRPGDKLIVNVRGNMPLDPYSPEPREEQLQGLATRLKELLGDEVAVVVFAGNLEITVVRAGGS